MSAVIYKSRGLEWQKDAINPIEGRRIPSNYQSTGWSYTARKVMLIAGSIVTLGLAPLFYYLGKGAVDVSRLAYHEIFDGRAADIKEEDISVLDQGLQDTINKLAKMRQLSTVSLGCIKNYLPDDLVRSIFLTVPSEVEIKEKLDKNKVIVIPIILQGGFFKRGFYSRNHITTLIIDPNKKKIIFIDPKGKTLADYRSCMTLSGMSVEEIFQSAQGGIRQSLSPDGAWTLKQNITQYQFDGYNCGLHYIYNAIFYVRKNRIPSQLKRLDQIRRRRDEFISLIVRKALV